MRGSAVHWHRTITFGALLTVLLAGIAYAHHRGAPEATRPLPSTRAATVSPQWLGPWASGSFFAPSRSGEGIILEYLPDGTAIAF